MVSTRYEAARSWQDMSKARCYTIYKPYTRVRIIEIRNSIRFVFIYRKNNESRQIMNPVK